MAATSHPVPPDQKPHPLVGQELVDFIVAESKQIGLDPAVPLSIIPHEGGFYGAVGDRGTSFGPFQLRRGGALPSQIGGPQEARNYAQSREGIVYALRGMERAIVAHPGNIGKGTADSPYTGTDAVHNAVYYFEIPANKPAEEADARQRYFKIAGIEKDAAGWESGGTGPWYRYPALATILLMTGGTLAGAGAGGAIVRGAGRAGKTAGKVSVKAGERALGTKLGKLGALGAILAGLGFTSLGEFMLRIAEIAAGAILILLGLFTMIRGTVAMPGRA